MHDLIAYDAADARERRSEWKPMAVVRNACARPRGGVAILRLTNFVADVAVGPGSAGKEAVESPTVNRTPAVAEFAAVQALSKAREHERTESPRHYPDDDLVVAHEVAAWVPEVPAYGVRCFSHTSRNRPAQIPNPAKAQETEATNGRITIRVQEDGRVEFNDSNAGRMLPDLLHWESLIDLGDSYTPSVRGAKFSPKFAGARVLHRGPVRAAIETMWEFREKKERVAATVTLIVDADAGWLRIHVDGVNAARDHRLRLRVATDVPRALVVADAMFGPVERAPVVATAEECAMETPPATAPLHRYVSLFGATNGATLISDGLAEYEADDRGGVAVTLLRAIGELSRADIPERPGHAGWPMATPESQCASAFGAELALLLHDVRSAATVARIERAAEDVLLPLAGGTLRSALRNPGAIHGLALEGDGLAFSCAKESEDGQWMVLRCGNLLDAPCAGAWRLGSPVRDAHVARLDETIVEVAPTDGDRVRFTAGPRATVTVLVR